jgi:acyl-ACP thioesterase
MFGFRNTVIRDAEGKACYTTWSMGAFVDMSTGKLSRISAEVLATMNLDKQVEMEYKDRRVFMPKEGVVAREPYKVMRNDIDYNKHVNNANYVRIAQEFLPDGWDVKSMRVEFRIPAKMGDTLAIDTAEENGKFYVDIKVDGNSSTLVEFEK